VASNFASISAGLSRAAATGSISVSAQNLLFSTNQTSGVVVFSLDASSLSGNTYNGQTFSNLQINVPTGVNYVINVVNIASGQTLFGSGVNFNAGLNNSQLLWNFEGSSNFTLSAGGNFYGSILAPASTITDNTTINGQVVASAFVDQGVELHDTDFAVVSAVVPESRAFAGWAAGLCLAGVAFHRRLLRRRNRRRSPLT
jgi:choice-of-anchor A domain-containing protein